MLFHGRPGTGLRPRSPVLVMDPSPLRHLIARGREHHPLVRRELAVLAVLVWLTLLGFSALFVRMLRSDSRRRRRR